MPEPLITTKLSIPPQGVRRVPRPRLFTRLSEALAPDCRLALVCAPAGYGKTSLVVDWIAALPAGQARGGWLALEEADNSPFRFFSYLLASLQKALPGLGDTAAAMLASPQAPPAQTFLGALINDLNTFGLMAGPAPTFLVLDDYQMVHDPEIHTGVAYLIEHAPEFFHIILTTRSDPPFPLHRYRARGQLLELRLEDLRFQPAEVTGLLDELLGERLEQPEIALLEQRTEGWAAGLQLAALSLRARPDRAGFIRDLSGSHRYILDYLAEEVLNGQPPAVQAFLSATALLDRLNGSLCDAVLTPEFFQGAGRPYTSSQELLEYLEHANLFLIALDEERRWYRYHALFAGLLRARLKEPPERALALHRRAAAWFEAAGEIRPAIVHLIEAGEFEAAANRVEQHSLSLFAQGELAAPLEWIRLLPPELAAGRPWLSLHQAWALAFAARLDEVEPLLQRARASLASLPSRQAQSEAQVDLAAIQALTAIQRGDLAAVLALEPGPEDALAARPFARSVLTWSRGFAWRVQGRLAQARAAFEETLETGRRINNLWTILSASVDLGAVLRQLGQLEAAGQVYRQALEQVQRGGAAGRGFVGRLESFLAFVLYEKDELEEARRLTESSIAHGRLWDNPNHVVHAALSLSRTAQAQGDLETAASALQSAEQVAAARPVVPPLRALVEATRLNLWLAQGRLAEAVLRAAGRTPPDPHQLPDEMQSVLAAAAARVWLAQGEPQRAAAFLDPLETGARAGGKVSLLIETRTLQARAAPTQAASFAALDEALALGLPAGFRRTFLDEGRPLASRLWEYRGALYAAPSAPQGAARLPAALWPLLDQLLARSEPPAAGGSTLETPARPAQPAGPFPLTEREVEILRLMASGLSNIEIGKQLYISTGTVKAHSAAIYRKLESSNRAEAVSKGKDLGLV